MAWLAYVLNVVSILLLLCGGSVVAYYWFLAVVAMVTRRPRERGEADSYHSFAIIIPAHNEEAGLATTLRSCQSLNYPRDRVSIYVVADNCTDGTETVAREHGVQCLVREDEERVGKGYALEFGFRQTCQDGHDVVLVLDADCELDPDALKTFNWFLLDGHRVLQGNYVASNPDESVTSYVLAVGNAIENDLFYAPQSRIGVTALLRGTGMVFRREVLDHRPWDAFSVAEDVEYSLTLARHGVAVRFVESVLIRSEFPRDRARLETQRRRWASGNIGLARSRAIGLVGEGLRRRNPRLVEAGCSLLLLSRPLALFLLLLPAALTAATAGMRPGPLDAALFGFSLALLAALMAYFALGVVRLGVTSHRIGFLLGSPIILARLVVMALVGLFGFHEGGWNRTPR